MPFDGHCAEIIHAGTAEVPVRGVESGGLDNRGGNPETGAGTQHRPAILGNVGLIEGEGEVQGGIHSLSLAFSRRPVTRDVE